MFTGIIQAVGTVRLLETAGRDARCSVATGRLDLADFKAGDSIAVNGVCLTATSVRPGEFEADLSAETLCCTTLGRLRPGSRVNLEPALRASDRLSGHLVAGHVDGTGRVAERKADARSTRFDFTVPDALTRYLCRKGSICVDGVSLTINDVNGATFSVNIIPHTLETTVFGDYEAGTEVNLEVDLIARYLERLQSVGRDA
ncbi:MAG: riboflavin synthase [Gammaproteobacteria bacterium]|nr:riboflavin synthase [Gammaproteobacteria bacterium]